MNWLKPLTFPKVFKILKLDPEKGLRARRTSFFSPVEELEIAHGKITYRHLSNAGQSFQRLVTDLDTIIKKVDLRMPF
jgi:hypothetical protein